MSDDDDKPLIFKRKSMTSKKNLSQKPEGHFGHLSSANGESSSVSLLSSPKASNPGVNHVKSPSKANDDEDSEDELPLSVKLKGRSSNISKVHIPKEEEEEDSDDEAPLMKLRKANSSASVKESHDSDDEAPLMKLRKVNSSASVKKSNDSDDEAPLMKLRKTNSSASVKSNDSDDEAPLMELRKAKSKASSSNKSNDSDDEKPLSTKIQQNGKLKRSSSDIKSSSSKKPKLSSTNGIQVSVKTEPKIEEDDDFDDEAPLSLRLKHSKKSEKMSDNDNDNVPLQRLKQSENKSKKVKKTVSSSIKKVNKKSKKVMKKSKYSKSSKMLPGSGEGQKWTTLEHNGVIFPPPYGPHGVKMKYKGEPVDLTPDQEEVATMYAVMIDTDWINKPQFKENFFNDWKKILGKNHIIQNLEDCDFTPIYEWHQAQKEKKKQMTSEEKKALKEEKLKLEEKYMWAIVDGVKEKVGNFRVEPPGLFRGRGEHPKMGKLKRRIRPSDITINIGEKAQIPECPIPGESWGEIRHDNTVTWLAYWIDPINQREFKYVFLAASSKLKGLSDKEKYEKSRVLKDYIEDIRITYTKNFTSNDLAKKQIAVATYLIDKLALRAGNEKDDDEADTVGCCTLKVENVEIIPPDTLEFDFLGKDSIRYQNKVSVEPPVFKAIQEFRKGKKGGDNLFDKLDTNKLNAHLKGLMPGLTAKVFRTYNASITLDQMLNEKTKDGDLSTKITVYNHANKQVAIICNHQRTVSKSHDAQMTRLDEKIEELKGIIEELKKDLSRAKKGKPPLKGDDEKPKRNLNPQALERKISQTKAKIEKMEGDKKSKEDLKTVALGTSKINYLDPRITVAWCKRHEVPIEKMFNKSLLAKFSWAMDVEPTFRF